MLGLGSNLTKSGAGVKTIVTDNLVLKHNYDLSSVRPLSDGAAYFDGTDDYVDGVGNCPISAFTISGWIKKDGDGGWYAMYSANTELWFGVGASEQVRLHVGGSDYIDTAVSVITVGVWHHIVATYDGSTTGKIYIDGVDQALTSSGTLNVPIATASNIGKLSTSATNYFEGFMCNIGLWSAALTQAQIKSIMWKDYAGLSDSEETDLVSWWNLDSVIDSADSGDGDTTVYDNHHGGGDTLGDEILINGDFSDTTSTDTTSAALTGWTNGGTHNGANKFTISDGQLTCTTDGTDSYIASTQTLTLGVTYKLTLDYVSGDVGVSWYSGGSLGTISTVGTHTIYYTAVNTAIIIDNTTAGTFTVDNISVKLVNGNTGTLS